MGFEWDGNLKIYGEYWNLLESMGIYGNMNGNLWEYWNIDEYWSGPSSTERFILVGGSNHLEKYESQGKDYPIHYGK